MEAPILLLALGLALVLGLLLVLLVRRAAPDPGLTALLERAEAQATRQGERMAALPAEIREEVARRSGEVAERLSEQMMSQTKALGEAMITQNARLSQQEQALADRMAETTRSLTETLLNQGKSAADALTAQNDRLAQQDKLLAERLSAMAAEIQKAITGQNERLDTSLAAQAATTQQSAAAIQERLAVIDAARSNIEALGAQVTSLAGILGNKQDRGSFGEEQMERIVTDRLPPDGFAFQSTLSNGRKPDCLIRLPFPPGPIAVDSKFPLEAWIGIRDATDDATAKAASRRFASDVQTHVRKVAESYILAGETAEGALLFVPSESIYAELHANHGAVVTEASRRGVYIVSPTTLWAVLGTMRALMRDVRMRTEAQKIQTEVRVLLEDVGRLDKRVDSLRRHFGQAEGDIEDIEKSTRAIKRRAERVEAVDIEETPAALPILQPPGGAP